MKYTDNKIFTFCEPHLNEQMYTLNKAEINNEVMLFILD